MNYTKCEKHISFLKVVNADSIAEGTWNRGYTSGPRPLVVRVPDNPSSNTVIVTFHSGNTQTNPGFQVTYRIVW